MKVLVCGGAGFVGEAVAQKLLERGDTVIVVDTKVSQLQHPNLSKISQDILSFPPDSQIFFGVDAIVDCVGRQYVDTKVPRYSQEEFFDEINVGVTKRLLELSLKNNIQHFIYLSSDMVYGVPQFLPITETHPCSPIGYYGKSKLKAESLVESFTQALGSTLILRPRFIIGPGRGGVFKHLLSLFKHHVPVPLLGSGKNIYQMIHRDDIVDFIVLALEKRITGTIHLGSKTPVSFLEIYKTIKEATNSKSLIFPTYHTYNTYIFRFFEFLGFPLLFKEQYEIADKDYVLDTTKAESFGWTPKITDREAIIQTIQKSIGYSK